MYNTHICEREHKSLLTAQPTNGKSSVKWTFNSNRFKSSQDNFNTTVNPLIFALVWARVYVVSATDGRRKSPRCVRVRRWCAQKSKDVSFEDEVTKTDDNARKCNDNAKTDHENNNVGRKTAAVFTANEQTSLLHSSKRTRSNGNVKRHVASKRSSFANGTTKSHRNAPITRTDVASGDAGDDADADDDAMFAAYRQSQAFRDRSTVRRGSIMPT